MATAALSLLPPSSSPNLLFPPPSPSPSSSFPLGGARRGFVSLTSTRSNNSTAKRRFSTVVAAASGDYYATLGVSKAATSKEIKTAYRRLARQVRLIRHEFFLTALWIHLGCCY